MEQSNKSELSKIRLEKAHEFLKSAVDCLNIGDYLTVANRSYYAVYYAIRALLILEHQEMVKHSGNASEFRKHYIKTGVFKQEFSDYLRELFKIRQSSDYDPMFVISKEEIELQLERTKTILKAIDEYLNKKMR